MEEDYAQEFIEWRRKAERCAWCGRDTKKNRKGFCRHCNEIRKEVGRLERANSARPTYYLDWQLRVAKQKKHDCIAWGQIVRGILYTVDALDLEHWFCMIAKCIARDDRMHYGRATELGWTFTPAQRQMLAYMFWEVFGAQASHNRQNRAAYGCLTNTMNEN